MNIPPKVAASAFRRLEEINHVASETGIRALRVAVLGGGCSGFSYQFSLVATSDRSDRDLVLRQGDQMVLIDDVSLGFLGGAEIAFHNELIGARFQIENPNVASSCGCGTSFSM